LTAHSHADWNDFDLLVQMPHMAPGEKLSEVEFLKMLAAYQWEAIARALHRRPPELMNSANERLYGSVIDVELHLGERHSMEILGEDVAIKLRNRVRFFAKKFVEGLFVIDDQEIPDSLLAKIETRKDLRAYQGSWACMTNAFIARGGSNVKLKVFKPVGADDRDVPELGETPLGIVEQGRVQRTGEIEPLAGDPAAALHLPVKSDAPVRYQIVPESDLNGASLVYFARYEAMMNYGERLFLSDRLALPFSTELISYLSTEHRKAYFFANATPTDHVDIRVDARVLPPGSFADPPAGQPYRTPLKMVFRIDLWRGSDNVLMASSLVRKSLNVPGSAKGVLAEVERFLRKLA
jgi:probable biosynthetic protein (TIGR04098 family)